MKKHEARAVIAQALDDLAASLERGQSEQLIAHLTAMARFHRYSWHNTLLIATQRPDAARVAGFNTWKALGRQVKKGERGILIIAPMQIGGGHREHRSQTDQELEDESPDRHLGFRAVYVFDISQTEGKPLPEIDRVQGNPGSCLERLREHILHRGITLEERENLGGPDGLSTGGRILVRADLAPAEKFSVLVHELAHEMLHHGTGQPRPAKAVRELEAEAVAHVVSQAIGLALRNASSDYIQLHQGHAELLGASLERIQTAAGEILDALLRPSPGEEAPGLPSQ